MDGCGLSGVFWKGWAAAPTYLWPTMQAPTVLQHRSCSFWSPGCHLMTLGHFVSVSDDWYQDVIDCSWNWALWTLISACLDSQPVTLPQLHPLKHPDPFPSGTHVLTQTAKDRNCFLFFFSLRKTLLNKSFKQSTIWDSTFGPILTKRVCVVLKKKKTWNKTNLYNFPWAAAWNNIEIHYEQTLIWHCSSLIKNKMMYHDNLNIHEGQKQMKWLHGWKHFRLSQVKRLLGV